MRISEILFWDNKPIEGNPSNPQLSLPQAPSSDLLARLAGAYAKDRLVSRFWSAKGSESRPFKPALPGAETDVIPSGTLEPTTASWQAEPVETEPPVRQAPARSVSAMPRDVRPPTWPT
jgi:hypothetical protein